MTTKRKVALPFLAVMMALGATMVGGPAHADHDPSLKFKNYNGNQRCLDVRTEDHHNVQVWNCNSKPQQTWVELFFETPPKGTFKFRNKLDNRCLEAPTLSGGPGEVVTVETCRDSPSQEWQVFYAFNPANSRGWFQVWQNKNTLTCLYLPDNRSANGNRIETRACDKSDPAQQWQHEHA